MDILGRFDLTLADVVRCTVYLADIADFSVMNGVFAEAFGDTFPARSTPQVQMPYGAKVGLEVTAFRGSRRAARVQVLCASSTVTRPAA